VFIPAGPDPENDGIRGAGTFQQQLAYRQVFTTNDECATALRP
jgi:hypothetical protein